MIKAAELKTKSESELNELLLSLLKEQFQLRMKKGATENPKTHVFGITRKNIARVKTELRSRARKQAV